MITIYSPTETDFSSLGLGALMPIECEIEEQAGGLYELRMTHPMDEAGKWLYIQNGCIIRAPAPVRESPLAQTPDAGDEVEPTQTVTRKIYKVSTPRGGRLHLRAKASTSAKILSKYKPGTEVVRLSTSGSWSKVIVRKSGATGWMWSAYLAYVRDETETINGDNPSPERVIYPVQSRDQLFRIVSVERDAVNMEVVVTARHIFYDLMGNVVNGDYEPEKVAANEAVTQIFSKALNAHEFTVRCTATGQVSGEYTRKSIVEALLDPDEGVVSQAEARLIRDNFDLWIMPDEERDTGVVIRHRKNVLGAVMTIDASNIVTRIIPVGQTKDGKPLLLSGTTYVDSPNIGLYPTILAQAIEYDVKVGDEGISNVTQARNKLRQLAQEDFSANAVDMPNVEMEIDFVALDETEEYRQYADMEAVHLYDTVRVIAPNAGINAAIRVTGYTWDAIGKCYNKVTLGKITDIETTVYSYEIPNGGITSSKIAHAAIGEVHLRDLCVTLAKIDTAAIDTLSANAITALKAYIAQIIAEQITTDELYAGIATIALAQLTTANIQNANIDWAQINALSANIVTIAKAHLTDADIQWAQITRLTAAIADVAQAQIENATISTAQIENLTAAVTTILDARIGSVDIGFAQIKDLVTGTAIITEGVGGKLYISRLNVTEANMVSLSVGELMVKGADGRLYRLGVDEAGTVTTELVQIEGADVAGSTLTGGNMIENTITTRELNVQNIFADNAMIRELIAANLDVGTLFAREATVAALNAADISGNASLSLYVKQADLSTYLRLTTGQVELGETDSPVRVQLRTGENAGLYIVEGTQANAYFGQNKARIERLEMGEAIIIGNTAIVAQNSGDDVYWLGR